MKNENTIKSAKSLIKNKSIRVFNRTGDFTEFKKLVPFNIAIKKDKEKHYYNLSIPTFEHENIEFLYRYKYVYENSEPDGNLFGDDVIIKYDKFKVVKYTPQGFKIIVKGKEKFVLENQNFGGVIFEPKKRFAYPTKEKALNGFYHRKLSELNFLRDRVKTINKVLIKIKKDELFKKEN